LRIGLVSRTDFKDALKLTKKAVEHLNNKNVHVVLETDTAMSLGEYEDISDLSELDVDYLITIGGDGTILRAAMEIKKPGTPLLGINMGRRGFLAEVEKNNIKQAIDKLLGNKYYLEDSLKVSSSSPDSKDSFPDALNEVLIASSLPSKMIVMSIKIDGEEIIEIQADGCLVSTPTGSTAYNMSAGGSVLAPGIDAMIITAICPYSYFNSMVVPANTEVSIDLLKPRTDAMAIIDGRAYIGLKPKSSVQIKVSSNRARFVRFKSFYQRLEKRFHYLQKQ
jgi:NAD+ kinase